MKNFIYDYTKGFTVIWWMKNENIRFNRMMYFDSQEKANEKANELMKNKAVDKVNIGLGKTAPSEYTIIVK